MAEETLVKEPLTQEMIDIGLSIVQEMHHKTNIFINAAFWLYDGETQTWKLYIASPHLKALGPRKVYEQIQSILLEKGIDINIKYFKDIYVVEDDHPLIEAIHSSIMPGNTIYQSTLSKTILNNHFIEDAYVLFLFN
jgi:hypothetical protein